MSTIHLSKHIVDIKDELTWGMQERLKNYMMGSMSVSGMNMDPNAKNGDKDAKMSINPEAMYQLKIVSVEVFVTKILEKQADGQHKEIPYSKDWLENLSPADGKMLLDAIDERNKDNEGK